MFAVRICNYHFGKICVSHVTIMWSSCDCRWESFTMISLDITLAMMTQMTWVSFEMRLLIFLLLSSLPPSGDQDNYGWKIISTDVFRFPHNKGLLCSILGSFSHTCTHTHTLTVCMHSDRHLLLSVVLVGVGTQFITLALAIILMALLGMFNVHR